MSREATSLANGYCPLCGFALYLDYDGHLVPCIVRHQRQTPVRR